MGLGSSFPTWAGTVLDADARVILVMNQPEDLWPVTWHLLRIGYPPPIGWLAGGLQAWGKSGRPLESFEVINVPELRQRIAANEVDVLDVRQPAEWAEGHIEGASFITGAELPHRVDELSRDKPIALVCGSGYRSSVAASLLATRGARVLNVAGGMGAWRAVGYPTTV